MHHEEPCPILSLDSQDPVESWHIENAQSIDKAAQPEPLRI